MFYLVLKIYMELILGLVLIVLAFGVGFALGMKSTPKGRNIAELSLKLKECKYEKDLLFKENEAFKEELEFLKKESKKILEENKDLKDVVGKLNRYLHNMEKASELTAKLKELLEVYEPQVAQKVGEILNKP